MRANRRSFALAVGAAALLLSSLPYAVAYLVEPADRRFMGIVSGVQDWAQYLAWMRAFASRVVIENVLTCEQQVPAFFNLQWLVLGRLTNWLPAGLVLQLFRLGTAAFFLWLTHRACAEYFRGDRPATWLAWLLINFSAGLGWIWVLEKRIAGLADARYPHDIYVYEPVSFQNMIVFPHFLLAAAALLLIFRLAARAVESRRMAPAWGASAIALALGLSHAYDLIIVYAVLGVFVLCLWRRDGFAWRPLAVAAAIGAVSAGPPLYFVYLTTSDPLWRQVLSQFGNAGVFTPNPLHLLVLLGVPLLLTIAVPRVVVPPRWPETWPLMVRVWALVNVPLLYIPTDYQIHMLSGWQIPLGLLASAGVFQVFVPWLAARGWVRDGSAPARRWAASPWAVVALLFVISVPTNVYLLAWRVREVLRLEHGHYLYDDEVEALRWLDRSAANDEPVLGAVVLGAYVPFLSGNKTYAGHWAQTVRFADKKAAVARFFDADTPAAERAQILAGCDVGYVLHGREERLLGRFDPATAAGLTLAHAAGETRIYRVAAAPAAGPRADGDRPESALDWSLPVVLSGSYDSSWFPDVATDPAGGVHVVWATGSSGYDLVAYCRVGEGGCIEEDWAASRPNPDGGYVMRPQIAVDAGGMLHMTFRAKYRVAHRRVFLPDPSEGWSSPFVLGDGTYTAAAAPAADVVYAAWVQGQYGTTEAEDPCWGCGDVYFRRSEDGGRSWSPAVNVSQTWNGSEKPQFALGEGGSVYVVWEEGFDHYVGKGTPAPAMAAASHDGGATWEAPVSLSTVNARSPAIGIDRKGALVVAWRPIAGDGVFFQISYDRGASWTDPAPIAGLRRRHDSPDELDGMAFAADSAGVLHLVAAGRTDRDSKLNAVYHLTWDGDDWSEPDELFRTDGTAEYPRIAVGNGNRLHVVWFERNKDGVWKSDKGLYRVWYAHAAAAAPAQPAAVWPEPPFRLVRLQTVFRLLQFAAGLAVVGGVIRWARRRGL